MPALQNPVEKTPIYMMIVNFQLISEDTLKIIENVLSDNFSYFALYIAARPPTYDEKTLLTFEQIKKLVSDYFATKDSKKTSASPAINYRFLVFPFDFTKSKDAQITEIKTHINKFKKATELPILISNERTKEAYEKYFPEFTKKEINSLNKVTPNYDRDYIYKTYTNKFKNKNNLKSLKEYIECFSPKEISLKQAQYILENMEKYSNE